MHHITFVASLPVTLCMFCEIFILSHAQQITSVSCICYIVHLLHLCTCRKQSLVQLVHLFYTPNYLNISLAILNLIDMYFDRMVENVKLRQLIATIDFLRIFQQNVFIFKF